MLVIKRDNSICEFSKDEVLKDVSQFLTKNIDSESLLSELEKGIVDKITTRQISELLANICASRISKHPDYNKLAAAICVVKLHKETSSSYSDTVERLYNNEPKLVSQELYEVVMKNKEVLDTSIDYSRDFLFDFFGLKTLERSYLKKIHSKTLEKSIYEEEKNFRKDALGHNNEELKFVHTSTIIERPQHLWMTVSLGIHGENIEKAIESYNCMSNLLFTMATPTLFNSGTNRQQLSSCFIFQPYDDIDSIFKVIGDCGKISKYAGGIGLNLTNIRSKGSIIRGTNGKSDGIIPLCIVLNKVARYINQSGKRLGSIACYLETWHSDIFEFVELRKNTGDENMRARDLFLAMWIPDLFMKRVEEDGIWSLMCPDECPGLVNSYGEGFEALYLKYEESGKFKKQVKAKDLWLHILDAQIETGMPYVAYKDNVNRKSNQQNVGVINSSNLCVAPETLIYTDKGFYPIKELEGQNIRVWNGNQWSETEVKQTGEDQQLLRVSFSNGSTLDCTPYHKFIISEGYSDKKSIKDSKRIEAKDLESGMKLKKCDMAIMEGDMKNDIKYPYTHGFFCGDGTYHKDHPLLCLYGEKKELLPYLDIHSTTGIPDGMGRINTTLPKDLEKKFKVPINASLQCRLRWLEGLFDADGTVAINGTNQALQLGSINKQFLQDIRIMLLGMGVNAKITIMHEERQTLLPDGKGGKKLFDCQTCWRILISSSGLNTLCNLGYSPKRLNVIQREPQRNAEQFIQVVSVEDIGRNDDTYCFTEPINNAGIFNGILTGNCCEINEVYDKENYAVCNLASISLPEFVKYNEAGEPYYDYEELIKISRVVTNNLNKVIDVNYYPTPETKNSNMTMRPIGLGVQGLGDVFNMFKVPYGSETAKQLNKNIFEAIYFGSLTESNELAKKEGPYSRFEGSPFSKGQFQYHMCGLSEDDLTCPVVGKKQWLALKESVMKYGTRNSLLTTCMPTASTSQIMGNTESFEPRTSNMYVRKTLSGEFIVMNEYLVKDLEKLGLWNDEIREEILYDQGSIQNIVEIPKNLKDVYLTAFEMKQRDIIQQSIDRSRFIDQSQSLNLFMNSPDFVKLNSALFFGWKGGLKTGMYYLRSNPASSAQSFGLSAERITEIKQKRLENGDLESYQVCPMIKNKQTGKYEPCESCQ
jgi:ribonucleoside-diphosphate reductase alpha chain